MQKATLCFLIKGNPPDEILLGFKKAGFGAGKYNGIGGKVQANESVEAAAARELEEETSVKVLEHDLQQVGHLTFRFPYKSDWDQVVHVFLVNMWEGEPVESAEMKPGWYKLDEIPFERMWQDDAHWLPLVLAGQKVKASFTFQDDNETIDKLQIETMA